MIPDDGVAEASVSGDGVARTSRAASHRASIPGRKFVQGSVRQCRACAALAEVERDERAIDQFISLGIAQQRQRYG